MDDIRLGIVGSGYMGRTYAHCVRDHNEGVELAGVTQGSRAPRLAADFGVEHFPSYEDMLRSENMDFVRVWGEQGMIEAEHFGRLRLATGGKWRDVWEMPEIDFLGNPFEPKRLEAFFVQTQDFVDCLRYGCPPAVSGEDGRAAIQMIEATHLSHRTGAAVELPLPRFAEGHHFDGATVERKRIPG